MTVRRVEPFLLAVKVYASTSAESHSVFWWPYGGNRPVGERMDKVPMREDEDDSEEEKEKDRRFIVPDAEHPQTDDEFRPNFDSDEEQASAVSMMQSHPARSSPRTPRPRVARAKVRF